MDAKALWRWEAETRDWATNTARDLALHLFHSRETATRPYGIGIVLDHGEMAWAEVPVRFNVDWPVPAKPGQQGPPAVRSWLVTSARVVGRLADDRLHGYRWDHMVGARLDLTPGRCCRRWLPKPDPPPHHFNESVCGLGVSLRGEVGNAAGGDRHRSRGERRAGEE
jgi:hypothetical protein